MKEKMNKIQHCNLGGGEKKGELAILDIKIDYKAV